MQQTQADGDGDRDLSQMSLEDACTCHPNLVSTNGTSSLRCPYYIGIYNFAYTLLHRLSGAASARSHIGGASTQQPECISAMHPAHLFLVISKASQKYLISIGLNHTYSKRLTRGHVVISLPYIARYTCRAFSTFIASPAQRFGINLDLCPPIIA